MSTRAFIFSFKPNTRERAIAEFESLLKDDCMQDSNMAKQRSTILEYLGISYHWNGQIELAEQTLRDAVKLSTKSKSKSAELYAYLGHICKYKGDFEEALMFYNMALESEKKLRWKNPVADMELVRENKKFLEKHKDHFPFASAYIKQQNQKDS